MCAGRHIIALHSCADNIVAVCSCAVLQHSSAGDASAAASLLTPVVPAM
jgi:hypothetical protein